MDNVLSFASREEFRAWLDEHSESEDECWLEAKRIAPKEGSFVYLDAVEEAICFGWIDSWVKKEGERVFQRFSKRKKGSHWTELNKERARRLLKLGLMDPRGKAVLPPLGPRSFKMDEELIAELKKARAYKTFKAFPPLYQRVRTYNVVFYRNIDPKAYENALSHLIKETKKGKMFGNWNDYGRLLDY